MSYYTKHTRNALLSPNNGEKRVFQALVSTELETRFTNVEAHISNLKASLTTAKKHSSATLLRKKLKGHLVRQLHEI